MNFMSCRPGFSEEHQITTGGRGIPPSSASSSALHHFTYHHHQDSPAAAQHSLDAAAVRQEDHQTREDTSSNSASHVLMIEKEHMFDKVVTPSDVGKLNRLVIPKQHAEKYFPLDSSTNEKGLLLNFEDRNGKPWRFRYSYWNSSQSYVMTKGWSRFVKEKKLDAGDIVSFQRGMGELGKDRLFIDWRRRPDAPDYPGAIPTLPLAHQFSFHRSIHPWNPLLLQPPPPREYSHFPQANSSQSHYNQYQPHYTAYNTTVVNGNPCPPGSIVYLRGSAEAAAVAAGAGLFAAPQQMGMIHTTQMRTSGVEQMVFDSVPVVQGKAAAKRLRLFGVNMDCPVSDSDECDISSHSTLQLEHLTHHQHPQAVFDSSSSSSPPVPSLLQLRPYNNQQEDHKGKGSMSLDLDI